LEENNIPKIIHYCWFGGKEKPPIIKKCIDSWKQYLADYEMIEWNEQNFDIKSHPYVEEAYECKKFAFVSDYVRVHALYHFGGIYLDTDVEVYKSFNDLLHHESFWGFEQENFIATSTIGAAKGNHLIKLFLDSYQNKRFIKEDGTFDDFTNVAAVTKILTRLGLKTNNEFQVIENLGAFYPQTYFSPYDYINCRTFKTNKTYTMHLFHKSWIPPKVKFKGNIKKVVAMFIGGNNIAKIRNVVSKK
jgi:mannosyltransferase OCH1-like enzyme